MEGWENGWVEKKRVRSGSPPSTPPTIHPSPRGRARSGKHAREYARGPGRTNPGLRLIIPSYGGILPECAGSALYAHRKVSAPGELTPLRRWLAASCLKATKLWCQCALKHMGKDGAPARARDLPDLVAALRA